MKLFNRKKTRYPSYPGTDYEPVLKCSICTGEQVACMRNRLTGQIHEIMLIRSAADLDDFCTAYETTPEKIRKVY